MYRIPSTRVPLDHSYAALLGKAVYLFAYYEWTILWVVDYIRPGFVGSYSRGAPLTSGKVQIELQNAIKSLPASIVKVAKPDLQAACDRFKELIVNRNALIHAHPMTDSDGSQILAYQTKPRIDCRT